MTDIQVTRLLAEACACRPRGAAVRCGRTTLTYAEFSGVVDRMTARIRDEGIMEGERVAVLSGNCHRYLACYFAALDAGAVLVPLNTRLAPREQRAVLAHSGARLLLGDREKLETIAGDAVAASDGCEGWGLTRLDATPQPEPPPDGTSHLYYTSGTTGNPKGVILTRANLGAHVAMTLAELRFQPGDVWLHAAPMFHLADAWAVWTVTAAAATHVMAPRYDAAAAFDLIAQAGVTMTNLVPTMLRSLLDEAESRGRGLPSLRLMLSGGAPIDPATVARVGRALGCEYVQTYGLTETSPFLTFSFLDPDLNGLPQADQLRHRARTGRAASGVTVRVVTPGASGAWEDVPGDDRSVGEVVARGATVTPGYWRDPEATALAFRDGWFRTGDLGTIDARGSIRLVDRAKDAIVTGGETVYSTEVENALYAHPAVREAAAFAVPDPRWGEMVRAAVVLQGEVTPGEADLIAFCRARIAAYKCPGAIDLLPALPRTGSGKIDKKALREPFWRGRERRIN